MSEEKEWQVKCAFLESRLTQVMSVAGKMAGALEHLTESLSAGEMEWSGVDLGIAKLALASWQDVIKKDGD